MSIEHDVEIISQKEERLFEKAHFYGLISVVPPIEVGKGLLELVLSDINIARWTVKLEHVLSTSDRTLLSVTCEGRKDESRHKKIETVVSQMKLLINAPETFYDQPTETRTS